MVLICALLFFTFSFRPKTQPTSEMPAQSQTAKNIQIIAFGDSLTAGYDIPTGEGYPAQLEAELSAAGYSVRVINSGVSGETTRGNLERAPFIRSQNADIILLGIGGNDALRSLPVTETKSNIEKTIQILQAGENSPTVILLQMQSPINSGLAYKQAFDAIYESIAKTYNLELVPFITQEIFFDSTNLLSDGIHLNKKGYGEVVRRHILPAVLKSL